MGDQDTATQIKRRGVLKGQLTRFLNDVNEFKTDSNTEILKTKRKKIEESWELFQKIQLEIEMQVQDGSEDQYRFDFEDLYFLAVSKYNKLFEPQQDTHEQVDQNNESQNQSMSQLTTTARSNSTASNQASIVKLAALNVPTFSGDYKEWSTFHDMFVALIHGNEALTDVQKFFYLKSALTSDALMVIQSFETSAKNYTIAWECLNERYNNKRILVQNHTKAIFDLDPLEDESAIKLRKFVDKLFGNMKALESLGHDPNTWGPMMIHIICTKLDSATLRAWEVQAPKSEISKVSDLIQFLNKRFQVLEAVEGAQNLHGKAEQKTRAADQKEKKYQRKNRASMHVTTSKFKCYMCEQNHAIYRCPKFIGLGVRERQVQVDKLGICAVCLSRHLGDKCKFNGCKKCGEKHNTLLHDQKAPEITAETSISTHATRSAVKQVLLSTAIIKIEGRAKEIFHARALLDSGSQCNFVTNDLAQKLQLPRKRVKFSISGVDNSMSQAHYSVKTTIHSKDTAYSGEFEFLTLQKITTNLPMQSFDTTKLSLPNYINLADPTYAIPGKIDVLIGAECFYDIIRSGKYKAAENGIIYQESELGWIAAGPTHNLAQTAIKSFVTMTTLMEDSASLNEQIVKFWQIEDTSKTPQGYTDEEKVCVDHFNRTVRRDTTGRFVVKLPLRENYDNLGESKSTALKRFLALENRFKNNMKLRSDYIDFMDEYIQLRHMSEMSLPSASAKLKQVYYMPHHSVVRAESTTTKTRVVFDASCKTDSGTSLNDILVKGPVIQDELICIISRFRTHKYAMSADIEKMYRQILISEENRSLQTILWRSQPSDKLKEYCLNTITYGTSPASYLATACLEKLAQECEEKAPLASQAIKSDFYMDDLLTGANTIADAVNLREKVINTMNSAGFVLRKWISNEPALLTNISNNNDDPMFILNIDGTAVKTLGLYWDPRTDAYQYKISNRNYTNDLAMSKRKVLSTIATIYDPLGLIGPVIVTAKILMQKLWQHKLEWDDLLPAQLKEEWGNYLKELTDIENIKIPRRIIGVENNNEIEMHGFADASICAYGACIYLKATDEYGNCTARLVAAKSRVAPLKVVSLARLELCAAVLLIQLVEKVIPSLKIKIKNKYYWTDSTIVLAWLNSQSSRWKTFVSHRVGEIHNYSSADQWNHVKSQDNPADIISRGCSPNQLKHNVLWWEGPAWIKKEKSEWTKNTLNCGDLRKEDDLEERKNQIVTLVQTEEKNLITKYSSLAKLLKIIAYVLRWKHRIVKRDKNNAILNITYGPNAAAIISVNELEYARTKIHQIVQSEFFANEIKCLKNGKSVSKKSKLYLLNPFLDQDEIIRVGGRLNNAENMQRDKKNPIVLPANTHFTKLVFSHEHIKLLHAGPQALLASVREKYWPLGGRNVAKKTVHKCISCFRTKPATYQPILGNLPAPRIEVANHAFLTSGVDFAGPILIKNSLRRNAPTSKCYICVFVCFFSKAVHIELVGDLTTNSFLAALRRFWARRGIGNVIYSDNGTNFVGANRRLKELRDLFKSEIHKKMIYQCASEVGVEWKFIPPRSPHFGGLWEAAVKSIKGQLQKTLGTASLTYEEMSTILVRIEACLNSRPITPLSNDPSDLSALTPGHFIIGRSLTSLPEPDLVDMPANRLHRWQRTTQLFQQIWQRWSKEYLSQLQSRQRWPKSKGPEIEVGALVLLKEDNLPPLRWQLGRVMEVSTGKDGVVRVAKVRTDRGVLQRAVRMLCPLPIYD